MLSETRSAKRKAAELGLSSPWEARRPSKSTANHTWGEVEKLLVGPDNVQFLVHKKLLIEGSPFFAAKTKPLWAKSGSEIDLSHISVEGFEVVVRWLYSGQLLQELAKIDLRTGWTTYNNSFMNAYKAADQLMMNEMQNKLLDDFKACLVRDHYIFNASELATTCKFDLVHTPYYRFVLRFLTWRFMRGDFNDDRLQRFNAWLKHLTEYPDAVKDLLAHIAMWRNQSWEDPRESQGCEFHIHVDGERCHLRSESTNRGSG